MLDVRLPASRGLSTTRGPELQITADRTWTLALPGRPLTIRALYPPSHLAFLSYSDTLVLLHWESGKVWQLRTIEHMNEDEFVSHLVPTHALQCSANSSRSGRASSRQDLSLHAISYASKHTPSNCSPCRAHSSPTSPFWALPPHPGTPGSTSGTCPPKCTPTSSPA